MLFFNVGNEYKSQEREYQIQVNPYYQSVLSVV